jgi:hypothetical protein
LRTSLAVSSTERERGGGLVLEGGGWNGRQSKQPQAGGWPGAGAARGRGEESGGDDDGDDEVEEEEDDAEEGWPGKDSGCIGVATVALTREGTKRRLLLSGL